MPRWNDYFDAMLTDEKKTVNMQPFSFSGKAVENSLRNKLVAKFDTRPEQTTAVPVGMPQTAPVQETESVSPVPETEQKPEPVVSEQPKEQPPRGRSVDELMGRLHLIQH